MTKQITIRGVPEEVGKRLATLSREKGRSINATVLEILEAAVGYGERRERLKRYSTWTEQDRLEFEQALSVQRQVDWSDWG